MRQATLQGIAFALILAVALCADGLMDTFGPWGFIKYAGGTIAVAGVAFQPSAETKSRPRW